MRIVSVILDHKAITKILGHLARKGIEPGKGPPEQPTSSSPAPFCCDQPARTARPADFRARGVVFREINLSQHADEMDRLRSLSWEHRLPVVVDHERVSIGFRGGSSSYEEVGLE